MTRIGAGLADRDVHVLMTPPWTFEDDAIRQRHVAAFRAYSAAHPRHRLSFLANAPAEAMLMSDAGIPSTVVNHNCLMDETVFRPLPGIEPVHDAVYNARLAPYKRIDLARDVESLALLYYFIAGEDDVTAFHAEHARIAALMPHAHLVNPLTPRGCDYVAPAQVNELLARSRVGLCLSEVEGAMRASVEYLFAGLPIVSTPSIGGRDRYFDDEYCIIVPPDPRRIREAVDALVARKIPRDTVRRRTLARVEADRVRYIDLVQGIIDEAGARGRFEPRFRTLLHGEGIMAWRGVASFARLVSDACAAADAQLVVK